MLRATSLCFALLAGYSIAHAQTDKAITRDSAVECAGVMLAGIAITPENQRAEFRRILNFYTSAASALETGSPPYEASLSAGRASHEASIRLLDSITSKQFTEDEKSAGVARLKKTIEGCVAVFKAHIDGLTASVARQK